MAFKHLFCGGKHETVAQAKVCESPEEKALDAVVESVHEIELSVDKAAAQVREASGPVTEDGMYRTPGGLIFKVQKAVHGSGHLYAKQMVQLAEPVVNKRGTKTHEFTYVAGAIKHLKASDRMTVEQAKEFGALYGTCVRCGLQLTKEESIERGMGSTCAGKF